MGFFLPALALGAVGGIASYFGQKETNEANTANQNSANEVNIMLARENRDWQERMANTAHEREIADLRKAGLNPILAANKGGAPTPSGGAANVQAAKMENALGQGVSSALASANLTKDLEMADSQKALNVSSIQTQESQQTLNTANAMQMNQNTLKAARENNIAEPAIATLRSAFKEQAEADLKRARADNKMATFDAIQKRVDNALGTAGSAKDLLNPFKGLFGGGKQAPSVENMRRENEAMKKFIRQKGYGNP